ncbi:phosphonate C-P lyase system protein PhnG [Alicyclobacillus fastidiosus]|uniref:Phosphonate C-P lyase system protein PhnG n=1 Tax=Alicyclobacillus fastidiosus TaxID=392011 RepID=A0ABV5A9N9_9BACL|nr:phosphonate C-P lyase system protein PhnG [Alicyclobacillus fastidiosus]WEH10905.1 phosphonate C-P lyase system protein PhnG [Alicyclobacillus fastidiosus]
MKRKQMTRILVEGDRTLLERLASQVEAAHEVHVNRKPENSLVMMKTFDPVASQPFYLGEVMVTQCTVTVNGHRGIGVLMGDEPDRAYYLAVVDAAVNASIPESFLWEPVLLEEEKRVNRRQYEEYARVEKSKVQFETMEEHYAKKG